MENIALEISAIRRVENFFIVCLIVGVKVGEKLKVKNYRFIAYTGKLKLKKLFPLLLSIAS
ncbi:hypothetical protein LBMAG27_23810 [Bacteroidota bacterium]|nr:hypothetical protein LBMAG27_23810 [Bacteroidota bacterium]